MVIDGKKASQDLFSTLGKELSLISKSIAVIQVGENPASTAYINLKSKKATELGIDFKHIKLDSSTTEESVKSRIEQLNQDTLVGGILLQLPLPTEFNEREILDCIDPKKDIDCLTSVNLGKFFAGKSEIMPATALGVIELLKYYNIDATSKDICMVGASNLVGKPLAVALTNLEATVTLCHIKTKSVEKYTKIADIVIIATGATKFFTDKYFSPGQTVIDIGISKDSEGNISGDVDYENVSKIVENITPVPGGVGPMTIYGIFKNFAGLNK